MERKAVSSSNIAAIGYDSTTMVLEVEFNNGSIYEYYDVPEGIYLDFINAASVGSFLHSSIKGNFSYTRTQ